MPDYASPDGTSGHGKAPHLRVKSINQAEGHNVYAIVFDKEDEVVTGFIEFAKEHHLKGAHFTGIGAFKSARLGWYDRKVKAYRVIAVDEATEVLSITGNITLFEDNYLLHTHCILGREDGTTVGGHLIEATVFPTLEVFLCEETERLIREYDKETGLALLRLEPENQTPGVVPTEERSPDQENL